MGTKGSEGRTGISQVSTPMPGEFGGIDICIEMKTIENKCWARKMLRTIYSNAPKEQHEQASKDEQEVT